MFGKLKAMLKGLNPFQKKETRRKLEIGSSQRLSTQGQRKETADKAKETPSKSRWTVIYRASKPVYPKHESKTSRKLRRNYLGGFWYRMSQSNSAGAKRSVEIYLKKQKERVEEERREIRNKTIARRAESRARSIQDEQSRERMLVSVNQRDSD